MGDTPSNPHRLAAQGLACIRADRPVFRDLAFAVDGGAVLRLTGPNGSGKSSLLRLLAGLGRPAAGAITWDGAPVDDDREAHRARTVHVGHADGVKPWMTAREHLDFWTALAGAAGDAAAALDRLGIGRLADVPGRFLSAGQRRRLALARAAAIPADLMLLDEPTGGLDTDGVAAVETMIGGHCAAGGVAVVATHVPLSLPEAVDLTLDAARPAAA
jgi:heme exporter protein A